MGGVSVVHWLIVLLVPATVVAMVVALLRGRGRDLSAPAAGLVRSSNRTANGANAEALPLVPPELETRGWVLLRDGQPVQAIKVVRDELGLDLRQSKLLVDDLEQRLPQGPA